MDKGSPLAGRVLLYLTSPFAKDPTMKLVMIGENSVVNLERVVLARRELSATQAHGLSERPRLYLHFRNTDPVEVAPDFVTPVWVMLCDLSVSDPSPPAAPTWHDKPSLL